MNRFKTLAQAIYLAFIFWMWRLHHLVDSLDRAADATLQQARILHPDLDLFQETA